jgi:TM2 domain-containing membrane protein YozV
MQVACCRNEAYRKKQGNPLMKNYTNDNTARRYTAHVSQLRTTQIHLRYPYIIAWWSMAYPGFGHLLLSKYLRGIMLFIWEMVINLNAHINLAIVYTFMGEFAQAKEVLDTRWLMLYLPTYFFAIWDSYRTTVDMNKITLLANREEHRFTSFIIGALEINYLDKRKPLMAFLWSFITPGLGQLYIHRIITAGFIIIWMVIISYFSHLVEGLNYILMGEIQKATDVLNKEWLLYLPSIYGFAMYDAYVNTVENNKLYVREQRGYLTNVYQHPQFKVKMKRWS